MVGVSEVEVLVAVPVSRLPEVLALLHPQLAPAAPGPDTAPPLPEDAEEDRTEVNGEVWTRSQVQGIAEDLPYPTLARFLDHLAAYPGVWQVKRQIEAQLGLDAVQLRNELGALTKVYLSATGHAHWPFDFRKTNGLFSYRMSDPVSGWWRQARQAPPA